MRVICNTQNLTAYSDDWLLKRFGDPRYIPSHNDNLDVGREYTVYGVIFWNNMPSYYLCYDQGDRYPIPFAREFFTITNPRLSVYWRLSAFYNKDYENYSALVFDEWAQDRLYYERLIDGDREAEEIFDKYRRLMDRE